MPLADLHVSAGADVNSVSGTFVEDCRPSSSSSCSSSQNNSNNDETTRTPSSSLAIA